jgi:uncharacterized protein (DUF1684 family)
MSSDATYLALYNYRQTNLRLYTERCMALRAGGDPARVCVRFRKQRDELFGRHPQSALDAYQKSRFDGLSYFPYSRSAVVDATLEPKVESDSLVVATSGAEAMPLIRVATLRFRMLDHEAVLTLFWINVYGGGLFLPFRDASSPLESYGGGRYLLDTVKGSDLFTVSADDPTMPLQLDFNYAYNPSCAYNSRWNCPLAPPENRLPFPIPAGERKPKTNGNADALP